MASESYKNNVSAHELSYFANNKKIMYCFALLVVIAAFSGLGHAAVQMKPLASPVLASVRSTLIHQINVLRVPMPANTYCTNCLFHGAHPDPKVHVGRIQRKDIKSYFSKFPVAVQKKMNGLLFAKSTVFHGFGIQINTGMASGHYNTYIGAGRRNGETVEFGLLEVKLRATLVRKHTVVQHRRCKTRWFKRRCRTSYQHIPRGNTAQELNQIEKGFRNLAVQALETKVSSVPYVHQRRRRREVLEDLEEDTFENDDISELQEY